ncbi:M15 family metallopeptidase [Dyadobacter luticola]|uniref:D-alanyl-D-alanine dipeptidase n=1 Tax=Dyadobacter luticola TaxID=1979387 RepID=A0A5R9KS67_9BACT|nr:M15 family metallopeptidase [Dyadobacter luticola]TLU99121.1 peptidase M15 [Dyadobacter luticola]
MFVSISFSSFGQTQKPAAAKIPGIEQKIKDRGLVNIQEADPTILVQLKYSTTDNFMHKDVYGDLESAYLQPEMAKRLAKANAALKQLHPDYRLLIYDAARPNSIQYHLWDALDDLKIPSKNKTMYVADPKIGSNHNFGCAVDLTIADKNGKALDMGTKFDFFGPLAYPRSEDGMLKAGKLTLDQLENRWLLRKVMTGAGFKANATEWWHFDGMSKKEAKAKYGMIP